MYSSHESINILTSLLVAHGIRYAVVCPGSRNAPIVHNLNECPDITCYPVTDERSAAFYALGIAQATDEPVVVCVTSGSALLNVMPAVAEAHYQHQSLIVISADRPAEWIGQLDGQTLQQPGVLAPWVSRTVSLPLIPSGDGGLLTSPRGGLGGAFCNRLINEALCDATEDHHPCVHINVPLSEPLFQFTVPELPRERVISRYRPLADYSCLPPALVTQMAQAQRPMIVVGQTSSRRLSANGGDFLFSHYIVLHEQLASFPHVSHFDEVLCQMGDDNTLLPDFVLYVGDTLVSKRLKAFLRRAADACVWRVNLTGEVEDTFQNLRGIVVGDAEFVLKALNDKLSSQHINGVSYRRRWLRLLKEAALRAETYEPPYSQMAAVRLFEQRLSKEEPNSYEVHYANSRPVRLANIYACHHVWCNRGVNGIEGSLSTAAGFSLVTDERVFCVIGDLSFFYDQNALWNQNLNGRLCILLLNNGRGGIFDQLKGLEQSPAHDCLVAGAHQATAEGICRQNLIDYERVDDSQHLPEAIDRLVSSTSSRPRLLEVVTDHEEDERAVREL